MAHPYSIVRVVVGAVARRDVICTWSVAVGFAFGRRVGGGPRTFALAFAVGAVVSSCSTVFQVAPTWQSATWLMYLVILTRRSASWCIVGASLVHTLMLGAQSDRAVLQSLGACKIRCV